MDIILKTFNSKHFDTSFDQIGRKCKRSNYRYSNGTNMKSDTKPQWYPFSE